MKARRRPLQKHPGLYIHSNPPAVVTPHPSEVRQWLRSGDVDKLESVVIQGQGHKLLGEYASDLRVRAFLKTIPAYLARIDMVHEAADKGSLQDLKALLKDATDQTFTRRRLAALALSKDRTGVGLLHKAVYHDHRQVAKWLVDNFPDTVHVIDKEGRSPLHYCGHSGDPPWLWAVLRQAGADPNLLDGRGHSPAYYMDHPLEAELPVTTTTLPGGRFTSGGNGLVVKQSNIRIWIHDQDLGRLQQVVWEGHGDKLLTQTSQHPSVKHFLAAVPYIMGVIKDVHAAAVNNDVILLKQRTEPPVPKEILLAKDINGLTPLHKAAGLGHEEIVRTILSVCPEAVARTDTESRTALHYAAAARGSGATYDTLLDFKADEAFEDKRSHPPPYYIQNPKEVDQRVLSVIPEAPRTASVFPPSWDWSSLQGYKGVKGRLPPPVPSNNGDSAFEDMAQDDTPEKLSPQHTKEMSLNKTTSIEEIHRPQTYDIDGEADEGVEEGEEEKEKGYNADNEEQEGHYEAEYAEVDEEFDLGNESTKLGKEEQIDQKQSLDILEEDKSSHGNDGGRRNLDETINAGKVVMNEVLNSFETGSSKTNKKDLKDKTAFKNAVKSVKKQLINNKNKANSQLKSTAKTVEKGFKKTGQAVEMVESNINSIIYQIDKSIKQDIEATKSFLREEQAMVNKEAGNLIEKGSKQVVKRIEDQVDGLSNKASKTIEETVQKTENLVKKNKEIINRKIGKGKLASKEILNQIEKKALNESTIALDLLKDKIKTTEKFIQMERDYNSKSIQQNKLNDSKKVIKDKQQPKQSDSNKLKPNIQQPKGSDSNKAMKNIQQSKLSDSGKGIRNKQQYKPSESNKAANSTDKTYLNSDPANMLKADVAATQAFIEMEKEYNKKITDTVKKNNGLKTKEKTNDSVLTKTNENKNSKVEVPTRSDTPLYPKIEKGRKVNSKRKSLLKNTKSSNSNNESIDENNLPNNADIMLAKSTAPSDKEGNIQNETKNERRFSVYRPAQKWKNASALARSAAIEESNKRIEELRRIIPKHSKYRLNEHPSSSERDGSGEDERIRQIVESGDIEEMAAMVLAGDGAALSKQHSRDPDIQMFINNIPTYLNKIQRVHTATLEGNLKELQSALDRRKFAVAHESASPLRVTPLHVAVLYGRTSVLRFLAGRFPETIQAVDSKGRTPLHYAAILKDNGHFYNLLVNQGADKSTQDIDGKTPAYYLDHPDYMTHEQLLAEFEGRQMTVLSHGSTVADKGLSEKAVISSGIPVFGPDEGRYLASSLGQPLIKGLSEVVSKRPPNPVKYLANYLNSYEDDSNSPQRTPQKALGETYTKGLSSPSPEPAPVLKPIPEHPLEKTEVDEKTQKEDIKEEENNPTLEPVPSAFKPVQRDEYGQMVLHFAMARTHGRNALFQLLQEVDCNLGFRDELYRTPRDVAEQVNIVENVQSIDKYVVSLAATGQVDKLRELLAEGYDHIVDIQDDNVSIYDVAVQRGQSEVFAFLESINNFEEKREKLHRAIRLASDGQVQDILKLHPGLAVAKNSHCRCSLHVAVLNQHDSIVNYIAQKYPQTLLLGDNLMRTALHYAMGVDRVESLSKILIQAGAARVVKDLKGRQPSYYFMNKSEIQKLQDEEEMLRV